MFHCTFTVTVNISVRSYQELDIPIMKQTTYESILQRSGSKYV